ncbi:MAG: OmpA family protein [candidate division Zixibacteria bacterium]|nr:OmpA family protein [candidate division Zixibacteria bacterium]
MKRIVALSLCFLMLIAALTGCGYSRKTKGAAAGAGAGAVIGGVIGKEAGNTAVGAILGAVIGGAAGAYIGNYMDKQAAEIERDLEGAKIERIGEGIKITFDSGILFDVNSSELQPAAKDNLTRLATILNKYEDTEILVEGHTDATGAWDHNMDLSLRRAQSVSNHMSGLNVMATRFKMMGYGPDQPIATNDTKAGRQENRRVDIAIFANKKLKGTAKKQIDG